MRAATLTTLLFLLTACGDSIGDTPDGGGPPLADSGTGPGDFDGCNLGIASSGMIIEHGQPQHYLVEFGRGDTRVNLARRYVDHGAGESKIFANGGMALRHDGVELCVTASSQLDYTNAHHNWMDSAEVTESGVRYQLDLTLDALGGGGWSYELSGFDEQGGARRFGPEALDLISGPRWP